MKLIEVNLSETQSRRKWQFQTYSNVLVFTGSRQYLPTSFFPSCPVSLPGC